MKFWLYISFFVAFLSGCTSDQTRLYKQKPAFYSYIIGNVKDHRIDTEFAADVYITPASCQKTITALIALKLLGTDYRYETALYATKKTSTSVGDVVLSFSGDPTFTSDHLLALLEPLKNTRVKGKIILDMSAFQTPVHSPNLMIADIGTSYSQPVSSFNIDKNLIHITLAPNQMGKLAIATNDCGYNIDSSVITTSDASAVKLEWDSDRIKASGKVNLNDTSLQLKMSPINIHHYATHKINTILKALNIKGKVHVTHDKSRLPSNLKLVNVVKSETLQDIIKPALKQSDNLVFDSLYLKIINFQSPKGLEDWNKGDAVIKDLVKKYFDVDMTGALFVDGSGGSRYNRIQPKQLFAILQQGFSNTEFTEALATPGEQESTLVKRKTLPSNIRAKTGSMLGISCLCGYNIAKTPKAFVITANSFAPPTQDLLDVIDKFVNDNLGKSK